MTTTIPPIPLKDFIGMVIICFVLLYILWSIGNTIKKRMR